MKVTLSWLRRHLETQAPLAVLTDRMTSLGLEVERVADPSAGMEGILVAQVLRAERHPDVERLNICTVDFGSGMATVVCGAQNVRPGMKAAYASPGSSVPGPGAVLGPKEFRGVVSCGMLLSERELGIGDGHSEIVELPASAAVGTPCCHLAGMDDALVEIAITPNRGDALGVRGIARDLAAAGLGTLRPWQPPPVGGSFGSPVTWRVGFPEVCPWVIGRTIRGVWNQASPGWLRNMLLSVGIEPVSALVDVTNFFSHDIGRPLHAFDADRIQGGMLEVRRGNGETFRALNGRDYTVSGEDCVISDSSGVLSLAGIVGGEATGCSAGTTSVFVECALFDPVQVALSGRRHQIVTEARSRFERGVDQALLPSALDAATAMIIELCGGEASEVTTAGAEPRWRREATMRFSRLGTLGGLEVPRDEARNSLEALGFKVTREDAESVSVLVPPWRNDIASRSGLDQREGLDRVRAADAAANAQAASDEAELVGEILRLKGLDGVPPASMPRLEAVPSATLSSGQVRAAAARRALASRGLLECVTFSFMAREDAARFGDTPDDLRLINPISSDLDQLRPTPVATLALAARRNLAHGLPSGGFFELGPAFGPERQETTLAGVRYGAARRHWHAPEPSADTYSAKADVLAVLGVLGLRPEELKVEPGGPRFYHPGRCGVIGTAAFPAFATFGTLHPRTLSALGIDSPVAAFEIWLGRMPGPRTRSRALPAIPTLQPLRRDFAFVVAEAVPASAVTTAARAALPQLLTDVRVFDVYRGTHVPPGWKSLAIEVTFQPEMAALKESDIEKASEAIVSAVGRTTGAKLRA